MTDSAQSLPLLLRVVPRVPFGRVLTGLGLFLAITGTYWLTGLFDPEINRGNAPIGVPLFFGAMIAYMVPILHYIHERAAEISDELYRTAVPDDSPRQQVDQFMSTRALVVASLMGLSGGLLHSLALADLSVTNMLRLLESSPPEAAIFVGTIAVWFVLTVVSTYLVCFAWHFQTMGDRVRVDLLDRATVTPFSRFAVTSTLAVLGAMALFPLLGIGNDDAMLSIVPGMLGMLVPMGYLLILPMAPLHRRLAALKASELHRIQGLINELESPWEPSTPEATAPRLERLATALAYRREVQQMSEWPLDVGVAVRFGLYLIIPPATWVGAALIENLVDMAI